MNTTDEGDRDEQDIARLLQAAGSREELPDALKQSWEASFRAELAPVIARHKWRRRGRTAALCASFALVALLGLFNLQSPAPPEPLIWVSSVVGESVVTSPAGASEAASSGSHIATGSLLATSEAGYLSLDYRGYDLRMNNGSQLRVDADGVHLLAGEIYLSDATASAPSQAITVYTAFATIRDIGTQFTVAVTAEAVVSTVRRGSIVVNTRQQEYLADAADSARRVTVDSQQQLSSTEVSDPQWAWTYQLAPRFEVEGSSAYEFLQWSATETGLELDFSSSSAEIYARTTILHGDLAGLNPELALAPVLATTHLQAQLTDTRTLLITLLQRD